MIMTATGKRVPVLMEDTVAGRTVLVDVLDESPDGLLVIHASVPPQRGYTLTHTLTGKAVIRNVDVTRAIRLLTVLEKCDWWWDAESGTPPATINAVADALVAEGIMTEEKARRARRPITT